MTEHPWFKIGHLIGLFVWIGGMFATYWLLRLHAHAPKEMHDKLTAMERALALMMDLALTLALVCGLYMTLASTPNWFVRPDTKWLHAKLTIAVLTMLPVHGIVRKRIRLFSQGQIKPVPEILWPVFLGGMALITFFVVAKPF